MMYDEMEENEKNDTLEVGNEVVVEWLMREAAMMEVSEVVVTEQCVVGRIGGDTDNSDGSVVGGDGCEKCSCGGDGDMYVTRDVRQRNGRQIATR